MATPPLSFDKGCVSTSFIVVVVIILILILVVLWLLQRIQRIHTAQQGFTNQVVALPSASVDHVCTYDQAIFTSNNRVVMYHAPWCTACTAFKPEWEKAVRQNSADVCYVTVNADSQAAGSTCMKAKHALGLPTILFEVGSDPNPHAVYNGPRTAAALVAWVNTLVH